MDRLFNGDVNRVRVGYGHLHVLWNGDSNRMGHWHSDLLHHSDMVRFCMLRVGVTFWFPFVGGTAVGERHEEKDGCCSLKKNR